MRLKRGQFIRLRLAGSSDEWCPAMVVLATPEGSSVLIMLNSAAVLRSSTGGAYFGGVVALTVDYDNSKVTDLLTGSEYEVHVAEVVSVDLEAPPN